MKTLIDGSKERKLEKKSFLQYCKSAFQKKINIEDFPYSLPVNIDYQDKNEDKSTEI